MQLAIGWLKPASISPVRKRVSGVAQAEREAVASKVMSARALKIVVMGLRIMRLHETRQRVAVRRWRLI